MCVHRIHTWELLRAAVLVLCSVPTRPVVDEAAVGGTDPWELFCTPPFSLDQYEGISEQARGIPSLIRHLPGCLN